MQSPTIFLAVAIAISAFYIEGSQAEDTKIALAPYVAQVYDSKNKVSLGTAAILSCKWVVTLAKVVGDRENGDIKIRSGTGQNNQFGGLHTIRTKFISSIKDDAQIAVIQIYFSFIYSLTVCSILPSKILPEPDTPVKLYGWIEKKEQIQMFDLKVKNPTSCMSPQRQDMLCTTKSDDSGKQVLGNPLVLSEFQLLGLYVNTKSDGTLMFSDISSFKPWIVEILKNNTVYNNNSTIEQCEKSGQFPGCDRSHNYNR